MGTEVEEKTDARSASEYDRQALADGELWRLWTAHLVHFSARHAGVDLLTLGLLGACVERRCGWRVVGAVLVVVSPLLSLTLLVGVAQLHIYRGASALCVVYAIMLGLVLWHDAAVLRSWLLVAAGLFVGKLVYEAMGGAQNAAGLHEEVRVAWPAHLFGAAFGVCAFAAWRSRGHVPIQRTGDARTVQIVIAGLRRGLSLSRPASLSQPEADA